MSSFTFTIAPGNNTLPVAIAISVKENIITLYARVNGINPDVFPYNIPIIGPILLKQANDELTEKFLREKIKNDNDKAELRKIFKVTPRAKTSDIMTGIVQCFRELKKQVNYGYVFNDSEDHRGLHSANENEEHVQHFHFRYPHKITYNDLKVFLDSLMTCEQNNLIKLAEGETLLSAGSKKNILDKFNKFLVQQKNNNNLNVKAHDDPCYNPRSIYGYAQYLGYDQARALGMPEFYPSGHLPATPLTPACQEIVAKETQANTYARVALGGAFLIAYGYGLFAHLRRQANSQAPSKTQVQQQALVAHAKDQPAIKTKRRRKH